ncbi:Mss4-like protein, partial [Mycena haematopus]
PMQKPQIITGGCNCGGVRYRVDFATDHDWRRGGNSCSCTTCRKQSGALTLPLHTIKLFELDWLSKTTYAEYNSSDATFRAFCKECGSTIGWGDRTEDLEIRIAVGTVDEEFLVGQRDAEDKPVGGFGEALVNVEGEHYFGRNAIKGVTDESKGVWCWKLLP